jgi:hypothetical protein
LATAGKGDSAVQDPKAREPSGAFVARLWPDVRGLRARVRHTIDLTTPEIEATTTGSSEQVVSDLIGRFSTWAEDFAEAVGTTDPTDPAVDEPMTPQ